MEYNISKEELERAALSEKPLSVEEPFDSPVSINQLKATLAGVILRNRDKDN